MSDPIIPFPESAPGAGPARPQPPSGPAQPRPPLAPTPYGPRQGPSLNGPAPYGPQPLGQPQFGPAPYGPQPQFGPAQFGPAPYGPQPQFGPGQFGPAPYGPQPQFGPGQFGQPQFGLAAPFASRPGTIPLRPLKLGDIFDGAFRSIRFAPSVMFGLTAIVVVISTAAQQIPAYLLRDAQTGMAYIDPANALLSTGIGEIISFLVTTILSGMLIYAVAQGAIGKRATIGSSWRAVGGRLPRLIGLTLLIGLMLIAACLIPLVAIGFGGGMMVYSLDTASGAAGGLGLILLGLLGMAVAVGWIVVRTLLAPAALVLEGQGVMASLKRGWRLSRRRFWRLFGVYSLTSLIVGLAAFVVGAAFGVVIALAVPDSTTLAVAAEAATLVLAQLITTPFLAAVVALLYIDARVRSEGLDLALMRAVEE